MIQMGACSLMTGIIGGIYYFQNKAEVQDEKEKVEEFVEENEEKKEEGKKRAWYRLNSEGNWVQVKPDLEEKIEEGYVENNDMKEINEKYIMHYNSDRSQWRMWIENTEKESFARVKYEAL